MSWDRSAVAALPLLLPAGFVGMMIGQTVWPLVAVVAAELGLVGLARRSDRAVVGDRWSGSAPMPQPTPAARERSPAGQQRGPVVASIAGVEIRELLLSPWFQTGVAFCAVFLVGITSFERSWWGTAALMPLLVHPLCGLTIVAVHRNVSRARRDGTDELLEACPVTIERRLTGHLLASVAPVVVATVFVSVSLVGASIALDNIYGPIDGRVATDVVIACLLLPVGATALGVLLGRKLPYLVAPIAALAVIAIVNIEFWDEPDGRLWLATGLASPPNDLVFLEPPLVGRLAWIVGLVVIVGVAGVAGARTRTSQAALTCGGVLAGAGVVLVAVTPSDATATRLAGYVLGDEQVTVCSEASTSVEVCTPEPYRDHGTAVADAVAPVAAAVPAEAAQPFDMRMLVDDIDALQRKVRDLVPPTPLPSGVIPLSFGHHESHFAVARFDLAAASVGIPVGADAPENVLVDGQARGVVMLWLAANGLDDDDVDRILTPYDDNGDASSRGHLWPGICGADVQWSPQDVEAARAVTALDPAGVADVLAGDWDRWTDPATTTDSLLVALGLPAVGEPEPIEPLGSPC